MGTETFNKHGKKSRKKKRQRSTGAERLDHMRQPANVGKADPFTRQMTNDYSKSGPTPDTETDFFGMLRG